MQWIPLSLVEVQVGWFTTSLVLPLVDFCIISYISSVLAAPGHNQDRIVDSRPCLPSQPSHSQHKNLSVPPSIHSTLQNQKYTGQVRSGQVRLGQVRSGQVRSGQIRLGQVRLAQVSLGQLKLGLKKKVGLGQV